MKKKLLAGLLASTAVVSLAACDKELAVSKIDLENQDTTATFGQVFADSDLKVTATMSDGTTKDVTNEVTIDTSKVDTSKPGVYAVVVSFGGQSVVYNVTVEAPQTATVKSIAVTGGNTAFNVGDEFTAGDVVVTATMSDNTTKEVTATIDSSKVDTSKPGVYSVVVSYEGAITTYFVTVSATENVQTLKDLTINATDAKTQYVVGESVSLENLVVYETYSNTIGADTIAQFTDLSGYTVKVTNEDNEEVTGEFTEFGTYTVTISKGELSDGFSIRVGSAGYESIEAALEAGLANADKVNSGSIIINTEFEYTLIDYIFGENYFGYTEDDLTSDYSYEYHYEKLENDSVFGLQVSNYFDSYAWETTTSLSSVFDANENNMVGANLSSFFTYAYDAYGAEALLSALYNEAILETSQNYKESFTNYCDVCGAYHGYSFEFGAYIGYNYYEVKTTFTLDSTSNSIETVEIIAGQYSDENIIYDEENGTYSLAEGVTAPDFIKELTIEQNTGDRTAVNEHPAEKYQFNSFDIKDSEENEIAENAEVKAYVGTPVIINVTNTLPETANANIDEIKVNAYDVEGNEVYDVYGGFEEGVVYVTAYNVGEYIVEISSANVVKKFKLVVGYAELTYFQAAVLNSMYEMVAAEEVSVEAGSDLTIGVMVNDGANDEFKASLPEGTQNAEVSEFFGDWYFNATEPGQYVITFTSLSDETVTATLTVNVEAKAESTQYEAAVEVETPWGPQESIFYLTLKSNGKGSYALGDYEGTFEYTISGSSLQFSNIESTWGDAVLFTGMKMGDVIYLAVKNAYTEEVIFGQLEFKLPPVELEIGENKVIGYYNGFDYKFTSYAYPSETYVITITNGVVLENWEPITSFTVTLEYYETYTFNVIGDQEGIEVTINIEISENGSEGEEGSDENTELAVGENTIAVDWMGADFTFTATEAGTYTFQLSMVDAYFMNGTSPTNMLEVTLEAGESYTFTVNDNNNDGSALMLISKA